MRRWRRAPPLPAEPSARMAGTNTPAMSLAPVFRPLRSCDARQQETAAPAPVSAMLPHQVPAFSVPPTPAGNAGKTRDAPRPPRAAAATARRPHTPTTPPEYPGRLSFLVLHAFAQRFTRARDP